MELREYKKINIASICTWERAKKSKVYKAGCFCVQVSATKGQTMYLKEDQTVDSKYCVFSLITQEYDPEYVFMVFKENLQEFLNRAQTGLNIRPEIFVEYEINLHTDKKTQIAIAEVMRQIEGRIQEEERTIRAVQEMKRYHLAKMFPVGMK